MELERNRTHSIWVSVAVPADAVPGLYRGTLVVRATKRTLARADFRIHVLSATVPAQPTLKVTNWFNLGDAASRSTRSCNSGFTTQILRRANQAISPRLSPSGIP